MPLPLLPEKTRSWPTRLSPTRRLDGPKNPLAAVSSARVVRPARDAIRGIRAPGAGWPGVIALGHWRARGRHDFVAVYGHHAGVVVELAGQRFDRLVVSVDDPEAVVAAIER